MRDILEKLLQATDVPDPERAQLRWEEYRDGADSPDAARRAASDAGFAMLLAWYGGMIYRHIWGFVRSDAAEDVFQEVLKKLHENRRNPRLASFQANVLPWLRQVAIRQCVDAHRRAARRRLRESRAARREGVEPPAHRGELEEMLAVALAQLTPEQQQAVALHYFEGLDRQDAAAALGINRDTFATRLNAALARLRKLAAAPAAVALGGTISVPAALAVRPPTLSAARLGELTANAWASASAATWTVPQVAAVVLLGLTLCGGAAAAWILTRDPERPAAPPVAVNPGPPRVPVESLQERNRRAAEEIAPGLRDLLQKFYPPDNRVQMVSLRAVGSEIEIEFRPERPPPAVTGLAARLRGRYCTFRRQLTIHGQPDGVDRWHWMDPEKPFVLQIPGPFGAVVEVIRGKEELAEARRLFDRLPRDARAEDEQIRFLFGPPGGELLLPTEQQGATGFDGGFVFATHGALYARAHDGRWSYAGEFPGWYPVVAGNRLYADTDAMIRSRPLLDPRAAWEVECPAPPVNPGERHCQSFVAGDRLYQALDSNAHTFHPLAERSAGWTRVATIPGLKPVGLAAAGDKLFGNDGKQLLARPAADPNAAWVPAGPWPAGAGPTECDKLVADGVRLLAFGRAGPIYARAVTADPKEPWVEVGRVHDPYKP